MHDACDGLGLDAADEVEAQQNGAAMRLHTRFPSPAVDTRCLDTAADHAGFVHVKFRAVEPAEVVDASGHVLDGPMRLQVQALVAFYGVRGGVTLGKGVPGEAFHLAPDLFDQHRVPPAFDGLLVEGVPRFGKLLPRPEFPAHAAAQHIRLTEVEPGEVVGHLDDVLLVHHYAVRLRHQLEKDGMGVVAPFGVPVPLDVGAHHAAARYAGPDDRARCDESEVVVDAELAHQHPHGG